MLEGKYVVWLTFVRALLRSFPDICKPHVHRIETFGIVGSYRSF